MERIVDTDNLLLAYCKARRGKQLKPEVREFAARLDENIAALRNDLQRGTVEVGNYHYFIIKDPKERRICAAPFRERVVHHALMNVCHEHFDRSLTDHTYATRRGKGQYAALAQAVKGASRCEWMVKLDYRKYFDSVDHAVLKVMLERKFKERALLSLFSRIIDSYESGEGRGLPIGNLTSQYFANHYLSVVDHKAQQEWGARYYVRYMDDILIMGESKDRLREIVGNLTDFSWQVLHLQLKAPVYCKAKDGVNYLGYHVMPWRYTLAGRSKRRFRSKMLNCERRLQEGVWTQEDYQRHVEPLLAFVGHAVSRRFRQSVIR